jgi:EmrB/QacA subfamily drug resistance transporter
MTAQIAARPDAESGSALISPRRRNFVFLAIMLGMLMAALDQTIVATALPTIVADLGDAGHQSWVVTSYLLASTIITALAGRLGDLFGRKRVFQAAVTFFVIGSALCGIAQSMVMLVGARALQGLGGGAITVTATALIGEIIPLRDRGRYQGAVGAVFGVTTVIGPLLGGYFTDHLSWRWAFYVNVPLSIVVLFVAAAAIPSLAGRTKPVIDYAGILFVGLGATGLTLATSWGGTTYPWKSATIIGLFVGSTVALAVFVWVESRVAAPILPTRLFASPVFTVCCVLSFVVGFAMLGALTFLPTYMQFVDGVSATTSGLRTLPMVAGMLLTSMGSGVLVGRTGRYKIFPVTGTAVMAVAFLLMSRMNPSTSALLQSLYLFILGAGIGLCMQVLILIVQNTSRFEDLGVATSGVTFFRTIGSSFGAAIFGSLFTNFLRARIGPAIVASGASPAAANSPEALHRLPRAMAAPIVNAYASSLTQVFLWQFRWRWSVSSCRCFFVKSRCGRSASPPPTWVTGSRCRPLSRRKRCWRPRSGVCCAVNRGCGCAASPCGPIVNSMSPNCGRCCASTALSKHSALPASPTSVSSWAYRTKSSSPLSIAWSVAVSCNATSTGYG